MSKLVPPYTAETAQQKVKVAQGLWNTCDPSKVKNGYAEDCIWRNRDHFIKGHEEIVEFLTAKWDRETNYTLRKELFAFTDNKIAVQFWYEYSPKTDANATKTWRRCYGLEHWTFNPQGIMVKRMMSGNEIDVAEGERWFTGDRNQVEDVVLPEGHFSS